MLRGERTVQSQMTVLLRCLGEPVCNLTAPRRRAQVFLDENTVHALAVSPDGVHLAAAGGETVAVVDTRTWGRVVDYPGVAPTLPVSLRFSRDGRSLVLGLLDGRILQLGVEEPSVVTVCRPFHFQRLTAAGMTADGDLLATERSHEGFRLWRLRPRGKWTSELRWGVEQGVAEIALTPEGDVVTIAKGGQVVVHDVETGQVRTVRPSDDVSTARLWGLNGLVEVTVGGISHIVRLWDGRGVVWPGRFVSAGAIARDGRRVYLSFLREKGVVYEYPVCRGLYVALFRNGRYVWPVWAETFCEARAIVAAHVKSMPDVLITESDGSLIAFAGHGGRVHRLTVTEHHVGDKHRMWDVAVNGGDRGIDSLSGEAMVRAICRLLDGGQEPVGARWG